MTKPKYPLEVKLEVAVEKTSRELLLWIKMIKLYFFKAPKKDEVAFYMITRGMWLLWITTTIYVLRA
jgi:hypothetical protein